MSGNNRRFCFFPKLSYCIFAILLLLIVFLAILHMQLSPYNIARLRINYNGEIVQNVALIKVHKAASSTLANILFRYGVANNLTFLLPRNEKLAQFWPYPITSSNVIPNCNQEFNILNVHSKFSGPSNINLFMPPNTKIIAILRHPATQLKSGYNYYGVARQYPDKTLSFNEFIDDPAYHVRKMYGFKDLLWNGMSVDLGLMNNKNIPWLVTKSDIVSSHVLRGYVYDFLESIEESIDLMLISEYFEESLVLLKRLLNWNLEDMAFFSLNKAVEPVSIDQFTDSEINKVIEWNFIDYLLYTRMLSKFFQLIYSPDIDINNDVTMLKSINSYFKENCIKEVKMDPKLYGSVPILGYTLNTTQGKMVDKCKLMTSDELTYLRVARAHMKDICPSGME